MNKDALSQPFEKPKDPNRRSLLKVLGLAGLLGSGALAFNLGGVRDEAMSLFRGNGIEKSKAHIFKLGQYEFQVPLDKFTKEEAQRIEAGIRKQYERLSSYFGETVMMAGHTQNVILKKGGLGEYESGSINTEGTIAREGDHIQVHLSGVNYFSIDQVDNDRIVLHELFHLIIQSPLFNDHPQSFVEGHAWALEMLFFPETESRNNELFQAFPELPILLGKNGWDIQTRGVKLLGERSQALSEVIKYKQALDWLEYLKQDPNFFKKYYSRVAELKKTLKFGEMWNYDSVFQMAENVSPGFRKWVTEKGRSILPISPDDLATIQLAKKGPDNSIFVVNIGTCDPKLDQDPGLLTAYCNKGQKITVRFGLDGKAESETTINLVGHEPFIDRLDFPKGSKPIQISIGGKTIQL